MPRQEPPPTKEGWFVLHDFRSIDWDVWRSADPDQRETALDAGRAYLEEQASRDDGTFAAFSVIGHKADFAMLHFRETSTAIDEAERAFERTALAGFTEQTSSFVSVTEVSGYTTSAFFDADEEVADPGLRRYFEMRLHPTIPDARFFSFYPMSKRREPEDNWYDLPFEERADHMASHGEIGKAYAGKVTQVITSGIGFDDWEWGVTLFANEPTQVKRLLYEMRFDPSTSRYAEFGPFHVGHRLEPSSLPALLRGEAISETTPDEESMNEPDDSAGDAVANALEDLGIADELEVDPPDGAHAVVVRSDASAAAVSTAVEELRGNFEHYDSHVSTAVHETTPGAAVVSVWSTERAASTAAGFLAELPGAQGTVTGALSREGAGDSDREDAEPTAAEVAASEDDIRGALADLDIYAGRPHGEDVYAMVLYSEAPVAALVEQVDRLREGFDRYDTHVRTAVYDGTATDRRAVVSLWSTQSAAETAGEYLSDLPAIVARAGEGSGFGTMGMFYTVKPAHRSAFREKFDAVGELLTDMDGHLETDLMTNVEDENDMFIASQWRSREDAMAFFRSDAFGDTVEWGRDILADRPRHVFLA